MQTKLCPAEANGRISLSRRGVPAQRQTRPSSAPLEACNLRACRSERGNASMHGKPAVVSPRESEMRRTKPRLPFSAAWHQRQASLLATAAGSYRCAAKVSNSKRLPGRSADPAPVTNGPLRPLIDRSLTPCFGVAPRSAVSSHPGRRQAGFPTARTLHPDASRSVGQRDPDRAPRES